MPPDKELGRSEWHAEDHGARVFEKKLWLLQGGFGRQYRQIWFGSALSQSLARRLTFSHSLLL